MSYADHFAAHVRIAILQILREADGFCAISSILAPALLDRDLPVSRDKVKTEIAWLAEQGLVTFVEHGGHYVATATERGRDIAAGLGKCPGVARPGD